MKSGYYSCLRSMCLASVVVLAVMLLSVNPSFAKDETGEHPNAIPVGTIITLRNWKKYKQYFTVGEQALLNGAEVVKPPKQLKIVVGPSRPVPEPQKFLADTEKYQHLVTLKELPSGGFVPQHYVAGYPFPNPPRPPHRGIKILYNMYYNYKPYLVYRGNADTYGIDKYGNITFSHAFQVNVRMRHISDVGMPLTLPHALPNVFFTEYLEQLTPEESKYFSILTLYPNDPSKDENIYTYIPALRRSLRSSSASRCAPLLGGDLFYDDLNGGFNGIPSEWHVKYDRTARILNILHQNKSFAPKNDFFDTHLWWPKPVVGKWELEKVYVLDATPIKSLLPGYCYSKKVLYLDVNQNQLVAVDYYDPAGKLWKMEMEFEYPMPIPGAPGNVTYNSFTDGTIVSTDIQLSHYGATAFGDVRLNSDVPAQFRNINRYASPGGLDEIMQ